MKTHTLKISLLLLLLTVAASGRTLQQLQQWNNNYYWDATATTWHQHSNGGCWVENTASIDSLTHCDDTVIVAGHAVVVTSDLRVQAWIRDYAQVTSSIMDKYASVAGHANVYGSLITDHAQVTQNAVLYSSCGPACNPALTVKDYALVAGNMQNAAQASGHSIAYGLTTLKNNAKLMDYAVIDGYVTIQDTAQATGCTVLGSYYPDPPLVVSGTTVLYTSCH